jgi:hypothetical protein
MVSQENSGRPVAAGTEWYGEWIGPVRLESRSAIDVAAADPDVRLHAVLERDIPNREN